MSWRSAPLMIVGNQQIESARLNNFDAVNIQHLMYRQKYCGISYLLQSIDEYWQGGTIVLSLLRTNAWRKRWFNFSTAELLFCIHEDHVGSTASYHSFEIHRPCQRWWDLWNDRHRAVCLLHVFCLEGKAMLILVSFSKVGIGIRSLVVRLTNRRSWTQGKEISKTSWNYSTLGARHESQ